MKSGYLLTAEERNIYYKYFAKLSAAKFFSLIKNDREIFYDILNNAKLMLSTIYDLVQKAKEMQDGDLVDVLLCYMHMMHDYESIRKHTRKIAEKRAEILSSVKEIKYIGK